MPPVCSGGPVAPEQLITLWGINLGGSAVKVTDSQVIERTAPLH